MMLNKKWIPVMHNVLGLCALTAVLLFVTLGHGSRPERAGSAPDMMAYHAYFYDIFGISVGSQVRIAGLKAGEVTHTRYDAENGRAAVSFVVDARYRLPTDTMVEIRTDSFFSGKHLSLAPGWELEVALNGATLDSRSSAVDFLDLLGKYATEKNPK